MFGHFHNIIFGTATGARRLPGQRAVDFIVTHPSQTRFACPVCKLVYTTHSSLVRHVDVSHKHLTLNISFKCALCDYVHANLRSTSNHFRLEHSTAVPPMTIDGSNKKACPFCQKTFSTRSCSTHIHEKHMAEASAQRAQEAAAKAAQRGSTTARTKWTAAEIKRFKKALKTLGPSNNAKLAEAVGTRDKSQVTTFKSRFLKANPTWQRDNHHPATSTNVITCPSRPSTRSPSQPSEGPTPPGPSHTERNRLTASSRRGRGPPPTTPSSQSSPPATGQQLACESPSPPTQL